MTPCTLILHEDHGEVVTTIDLGPRQWWTTVFPSHFEAAGFLQNCGALTGLEADTLYRNGLGGKTLVMPAKIPNFKHTIARYLFAGADAQHGS